jgi:aminoglycoside phosphotransferase (APT) family kinase protein
VQAGHETFALRVFRDDEGAVCAREIVAMQAAGAAGIPVPRVHGQAIWRERPAMLISWCAGRPMISLVLREPWRAFGYGLAFGETQAAIHAITAPPELAVRPWLDWKGPHRPAVRSRLEELGGSAGRLLHLDYHMLNVMADGGRVSAVLDWTNARSGDPRADLARTLSILRLDMGRPALPVLEGLAALWRVFEAGWWRGYTGAAGVPSDLAPFYAWAGIAMEHDLAHRYTPKRLAHVRRWAERWERKAGLEEDGRWNRS